MSQVTRINRPTYATPRKNPPRRFIHVSTRYGWRPVNRDDPRGPVEFRKLVSGVTYRRVDNSSRVCP